jgi:hypothetical protein
LDRLRHWSPAGIADPIDVHGLMPHDGSLVLLSLAASMVGATRTEVDAAFDALPATEQDAIVAITQTSGTSGFEGLPLSIELAGFSISFATASTDTPARGVDSSDGGGRRGRPAFAEYQAHLERVTAAEFTSATTVIGEGGGAETTAAANEHDPFSPAAVPPTQTDDKGESSAADGAATAAAAAAPPQRTEADRRQMSLVAMWHIGSTDFETVPGSLAVLQALACFDSALVPEGLVKAVCADNGVFLATIDLLVHRRGILKRAVVRGVTCYSIHPMVMRLLRRRLRGKT